MLQKQTGCCHFPPGRSAGGAVSWAGCLTLREDGIVGSSESLQAALRKYRSLNRLFWLGLLGIVLFPVAAVIVAAVVYQITKNSNLSSPIGLSAPLWSVAGVAIALLVRGARKQARRGVDLARIAEEEQYEFALQAAQPVLELLSSISFMQNPTSAKGRNVLSSVDGTVRHFALDYFYAYDYGAVSFEADESLVVFPDLVPDLPDLCVFPMGVADRLLSQVFGAFQQVKLAAAPEFTKRFHVGSADPAAAQRMITVPLRQTLDRNPELSLVIEDGTLIVFSQLQLIPAPSYVEFLTAAKELALAVRAVR